jgi:hypothetical protein
MAAPPYIVSRNLYGGLGLRTRTVEAGRARIICCLLEQCAVEVKLESVELEVEEPCGRDMVADDLKPGIAAVASGRVEVPAPELIDKHRHGLDELARDAWGQFGPPGAFGSSISASRGTARWAWRAEGTDASSALDTWYPFLVAHQALEFGEYRPRVSLRVRHTFLLCRTGRSLPEPAFPRSGTAAHLCGRHASAFFELVFPYGGVEPAFVDDYSAVCAATGLKLPANRFRLNAPTKKGDRKLVRLPTFP